jgi:hypothetical protein
MRDDVKVRYSDEQLAPRPQNAPPIGEQAGNGSMREVLQDVGCVDEICLAITERESTVNFGYDVNSGRVWQRIHVDESGKGPVA